MPTHIIAEWWTDQTPPRMCGNCYEPRELVNDIWASELTGYDAEMA